MNWRTKLAVASVVLLSASASQAQLIGPGGTAYLQRSDSPWHSMLDMPNFRFEDFEDGLFNVTGATGTGGSVQTAGLVTTDCVDGDDGTVDGSGNPCRSYGRTNQGMVGLQIDFDNTTLGGYPTHVGLAFTDGRTTSSFEAFDANLVSLGSVTGDHFDTSNNANVDEDRFYGIISAGGVRRVIVRNLNVSNANVEIDHLQFGRVIPEPATLTLAGLALATMLRRRVR